LFIAAELRTAEPMLPMRLFASRSFSAGSATTFLLSCALFGAVFFMAQFLQVSLGQGPLASGVRLLPWTGCLFIVAPIAGSRADRIGNRPLIVLGLTLQAAGFAWIALIAKAGLAYWEMIPPLMLAGVGISMAIPGAQNAVISAVAVAEVGKASGTATMMRQLGGVFGLAFAAAIFTGAGGYASPTEFANGFVPAIAVAGGFSLAGALVATAIPNRARRAASHLPASGGAAVPTSAAPASM
jgi:MFS family permease